MFKIDMYGGKPFNRGECGNIDIFWSDGQMKYWGWIYSKDKINGIIGDFTSDSVHEAEEALGVKFKTIQGESK